MSQFKFEDRRAGGRALGERLSGYAGAPSALVLALPRGGVPVGYEVARALRVPLDVFLVRKLGTPGHEELAMGAIADGGVRVVHEEVVRQLGLTEEDLERAVLRETGELARRNRLYRGERPAPHVRGRTVVLVDDGLATGSTMRAAIEALRAQAPARLVVGTPVAAADTCRELEAEVDEVVCATTPEPFRAVGLWYRDFEQTSDEEVQLLLAQAAQEQVGASSEVAHAQEGL